MTSMDANILKPADNASTELGRRVKAARMQHDFTLDVASRVCGVSRSTLSKIENGHVADLRRAPEDCPRAQD